MKNRRATAQWPMTVLAVATLTLPLATNALGQTSATATFSQMWMSWSETDIVRDDGLAPTGTALVEQTLAGEKLRLFYALDAGDYPSAGDWSFFEHNAGAVYRGTVNSSTRLFFSGSAWWRANGESWQAADYRGLSAAANLEHELRPTATLRAGYRLDARWFPELTAMDQLEHSGFVSAITNLPSRTTLIGEALVGGKSYGGGMTTFDPVPAHSNTTSQGVGGYGARGRGLMLGSLTGSPISIENAGLLAGQFTLFGRVAQSLADRTGVHLEASRRFTFGDKAPAVIATPELLFDDGVYDDPYASDAVTWRAGVKHIFARGIVVEGGVNRFDKHYTATLALAADGEPVQGLALRNDDIWQADAACTVPLWPGRTGKTEFSLLVSYLFTDHASNDAFYNYRSQGLGVGLSVKY